MTRIVVILNVILVILTGRVVRRERKMTMKNYYVKRIGMRDINRDSFVLLFGEEGEAMRRQAAEALESYGMAYGAFNESDECVSCFAFRKVKDYDLGGEICTAAVCEEGFTAQGHAGAEIRLREKIQEDMDSGFICGHMGCGEVVFEDEAVDFCACRREGGFTMKNIIVFIVFYLIFRKVFIALVLTLVFGNFILSLLGIENNSAGSDDIASL